MLSVFSDTLASLNLISHATSMLIKREKSTSSNEIITSGNSPQWMLNTGRKVKEEICNGRIKLPPYQPQCHYKGSTQTLS